MTLSAQAYEFVAGVAKAGSGLALQPSKEYLIESRLAPLARAAGAPDVNAWVLDVRRAAMAAPGAGAPLDRGLGARKAIIEALTTNETSWMRDTAPFTEFIRSVLPVIARENSATRRIRIWSAACSTGQEPYSLAMLLTDWKRANPTYSYRIQATDIDSTVLATARAGRFSTLEMNRGLPAQHLSAHFTREGAAWQLSEAIRQQVMFAEHNLVTQPTPPGPFDVIFCRNVLIYFDLDTKREVLAKLRGALRPGGYLYLGAAETALGIDPVLERVQLGRTTVYRRPAL
ncbi:protein-glutamate O-methyltransferase CheR [Nocardioides sp. GY 10113]|uniref:CheR family methyltransferase n=1 Tax=Nocardioides sp. GY 10113 TaxID=2569761 RepID=UPI0010A817C8|nr:protein-glutamate O-methyltransferase CheR [Nocardioides sp. GY 10113]TIC85961.1 protein-glutamate O-methyltransferase CheR [Nocardioides sp. GY 10113]